jgi:hypothetical protein
MGPVSTLRAYTWDQSQQAFLMAIVLFKQQLALGSYDNSKIMKNWSLSFYDGSLVGYPCAPVALGCAKSYV